MTDTLAPAPEPLLLDPNPRRFGPVTRRLLARTAAVVALVEIVGAVLVFGVGSDHARAAGLSLVHPGGGLLFTAHPVAFALTQVLLVVALVLWWGASAHVAIPLVWLGSAGAAFLLVDAPRVVLDEGTTWPWAIPVAYLCALATLGTMAWKLETRFRAKRAMVPELNEHLRTVELPAEHLPPREPNDVDAELLRWCYDLADQPHDGLRGFDWGEQLHGGTQLRYQLNRYCWAMSLYAANHLPNAPTQIEAALARMVLKHTDLRVWRYWRTLNLVGNLDPNPDPIARDNIMFSAFLGDVVNMYEAATGSTRFDEPGSLTFVWKDGRAFPYDHHSIAEAVRANFERSGLGFFPCEPGWSFTVCNIFGAQTLFGHDTLHGTDHWARYGERWRRTLDEEYLTPDGSYAHIRSNHTGLSWDTGEVPDGHYHSNGTGRFADILPAHHRRARALDLRRAAPMLEMLAPMVVDGVLDLEVPEELERHRTRANALSSWVRLVGGAALCGDAALTEAAIRGADKQCATGARWPERPMRASAADIGSFLIVRWSSPLGPADLNRRGYVAPTGPILAATAWDNVLVTLARSPEGASLDLALEPRPAAPLEAVPLAFEQLAPGAQYRLHGSGRAAISLTADDEGRAQGAIPLAGRTRLRLELGS